MGTHFDVVNDIFFKRVIKDPDFFSYTNVTEAEALELMETNALDYMKESVSSIYENCTPEVDFDGYDEILQEFPFDLTKNEIQMLVNLMFEKFLSRDKAKLKIYNKYFSTNEISIFSPAQERKTFVDMLDGIEKKNLKAIKSYASRDRLTNALKSFNGGNSL